MHLVTDVASLGDSMGFCRSASNALPFKVYQARSLVESAGGWGVGGLINKEEKQESPLSECESEVTRETSRFGQPQEWSA